MKFLVFDTGTTVMMMRGTYELWHGDYKMKAYALTALLNNHMWAQEEK